MASLFGSSLSFFWRKFQTLRVRSIIAGADVQAAVQYLRNPNPGYSPMLLRAFHAEIGDHSTFKRSVLLDNVFRDRNSTGDFSHLQIGSNCYIGDNVYFDLADEVFMGDNAILSGRVSVITHADCNRSPYLAQRFPRKCAPVIIGSGAWIGFGVTILAGCTVGENALLAAQSLVSSDIDSHALYAGTPAKKIRDLK